MKKAMTIIMMVMVAIMMEVTPVQATILPTFEKTETEEYELFVVTKYYEKTLFGKWTFVKEEWSDVNTGYIFLIEDENHDVTYSDERNWMKSLGIRFEN